MFGSLYLHITDCIQKKLLYSARRHLSTTYSYKFNPFYVNALQNVGNPFLQIRRRWFFGRYMNYAYTEYTVLVIERLATGTDQIFLQSVRQTQQAFFVIFIPEKLTMWKMF